MKYFVKGWEKDTNKATEIIEKYNNYYKSVENTLSNNVKNAVSNRHDTYIVNSHFIKNNYVMELEAHIWGKANIVFYNAIVKPNSNIKNDYWLYDEIYQVLDKIELHISFGNSNIIISCDDICTALEEKDYFQKLYIKEDYNMDFTSNKENIANTVIDKEKVCGNIMLKPWEQVIFSFIQIYNHINYYKYNNIEDKLANHYYKFKPNLSIEEKQNLYKTLFEELEEKIINNIQILEKYTQIIKQKELDNIINEFLEIYNKNISIKRKNQLYINIGEQNTFNLVCVYRRILECINANLII